MLKNYINSKNKVLLITNDNYILVKNVQNFKIKTPQSFDLKAFKC